MLLDLLTLPLLGGPRMVHWVARSLLEAAGQEEMDEGKLQGQLLNLQIRHDLGEMGDDEYTGQETAILNRLSSLHKAEE